MSYATEQEKIEQPSYAELYDLEVMDGNSEAVHFTSYGTNVIFRSTEYVSKTIKRTGFTIDRTLKAAKVTLSATITSPLSTYIAQSPYAPCKVTIWRLYLTNPNVDYIKLFAGKLQNIGIKNFVMSSTFASESGSFDKIVPRNLYSRWCVHSLFDENCGVTEALWKKTVTVNSISGNVFNFPDIASFGSQFYRSGVMQFNDERRLITDQTGANVTILFPFGGAVASGSSVILIPGCTGEPALCKIRFNNIDKYLGFPYIPTKNMVIWGFR